MEVGEGRGRGYNAWEGTGSGSFVSIAEVESELLVFRCLQCKISNISLMTLSV